jgi:hypothetical protein
MGKQRIKPNYRRGVLRLPDLDHCKLAVLNSLGSPASRRVYEYSIDQFIAWYCSEPRLAFSVCASSRSSFLRLSPISRTLRAFATITSCPNSLSKRLNPRRMCPDLQRDPAVRHYGEDFLQRFHIRADALLQLYLAGFLQYAVPAVAVS